MSESEILDFDRLAMSRVSSGNEPLKATPFVISQLEDEDDADADELLCDDALPFSASRPTGTPDRRRPGRTSAGGMPGHLRRFLASLAARDAKEDRRDERRLRRETEAFAARRQGRRFAAGRSSDARGVDDDKALADRVKAAVARERVPRRGPSKPTTLPLLPGVGFIAPGDPLAALFGKR